MDKGEMFKIFKLLTIDKPEFGARITGAHGEAMLEKWVEVFKDVSLEDMTEAVNRFIETNTSNYFPNIARIKALLPDTRKDFGRCLRGYKPDGSLIAYHVNRYGEIEDDEGRIYADPNPEVDKMLASRVRSTGKLLTEDELKREAIVYGGQGY